MQCVRLSCSVPTIIVVLAIVTASSSAVAKTPDGGHLYHEYCSVCHGDRGDGQSRARQGLVPPPKDFSAPSPGQTRERMIEVVRDGKPGTAMTGWKTRLNDMEIAAIVDHIRANFTQGRSKPPAPARHPATTAATTAGRDTRSAAQPRAPAHDAPLPQGLRGNVANGGDFYKANCATCHGERGDGNGPRAYFIFPKPRNFLDPMVRQALNRPALFRGTKEGVSGREMPAWGKVIDDQQIADVTEYVYQSFIRPSASGARR